MKSKERELVDAAKAVLSNAYSPYSGLKFSAAVLEKNGRIYTGCNIENASYGVTVCAERAALCNAVSDGCRDIVMMAVVSGSDVLPYPCGMCRQMLSEFAGGDCTVLLVSKKEEKSYSLSQLLPEPFSLEK